MRAYLKGIGVVVLVLGLASGGILAQTADDADFDNSGAVDFADFLMFAQAFGSAETAYDLSGNGRVDFEDFLVFVRFFGQGTARLDTPVADPYPPSTLLPPGATSLSLSVKTASITSCAYAVGTPLPYPKMTAFGQEGKGTSHTALVEGLSPDPNVLNHVYVRCEADTTFALHLRYRVLPDANPSYPRTGNLWGSWRFREKGLPYVARVDLWQGATFTPEEIRELRRLNPDILILSSINAVEHKGLPEDYYLKDITGKRIEVWPDAYRLNLTLPHVAERQARTAYERILDNDLMYDGMFFDNVMTTQSWLKSDIYGNPARLDADGDGVEDDPQAFDAAWNAGVHHEIEFFRELMPHAIVTGHSMQVHEPGIAEMFNGLSIGFWTTDVIEAKRGFSSLWGLYEDWHALGATPSVTMVESAPPDQIAYGYDYHPWEKVPASTLEFSRTYYPYVRFGLAFTLMNNGYFAHEFGDMWHGNDWWYDELDFDLGVPLGPAERVDLRTDPGENRVVNGDFEAAIGGPWGFWANAETGCVATVQRDTADAAEGRASARIDISATSGVDWHIDFSQRDRSLTCGISYGVTFRAKASSPRSISLGAQKGSPDWRNYGLQQQLAIGTEWQAYTVSFTANETTSESRLQFRVGGVVGTVWLDDVRLILHPPEVYRREFANGLVLLNGSREAQQVDLGPGYSRLTGHQAPRYEAILDDSDGGFSTTGDWTEVTYDSGEWKAEGPFYHDWGPACHEGTGTSSVARWDLQIPEADTYEISAWWPAAPQSSSWSKDVVFQVIVNGRAVRSTVVDQHSGGDEWHTVAKVSLTPGDETQVEVLSLDGVPCIADALHIFSEARYNDGSPADGVVLQPMDGIVLRRSD